jgi:hypothetical protein
VISSSYLAGGGPTMLRHEDSATRGQVVDHRVLQQGMVAQLRPLNHYVIQVNIE